MPRHTYALIGVVIALVGLLSFSYFRSNRFEREARGATKFANEQRHANAILNDLLTDTESRVAERNTVLAHDSTTIAETDLRNPPPDTCKPNLAARDRTIADQKDQITDLQTALAIARRMLTNSDSARDGLQRALDARPRPLLSLPFLEIGLPKLGAFAGVCTNGGLCGGAGVTIPIHIGGR